ncbi:MAG: hypothetical protein IKI84_06480, partial [Clostridia bacterium]|nr:hypothetical protein [Clostridia bacterium]
SRTGRQQAGGYPPQGGAYSPQNGTYAQQGSGYPPQGGAYPPQGAAYAPQNGVYPPQNGSYPPQGGAYPPQGGSYPPQSGSYPPQIGAYPPQGGSYPPQGGAYPPQGGGYPPQEGPGYPPQGGTGYPPQNGSMPPQGPYTPDWGKTDGMENGGDKQDGDAPEGEEGSGYRPPAPPEGPRAVPSTGVRGRGGTRKGVYVIVAVLALAICAGGVWLMLRPGGKQYAYVRRSTLATSYSGDALIVRNETVYTQEGVSRIEYIAEEGAMVERAENVCVVYNSGFSDKELTTLENYRKKIKEYHRTLLSNSTTKDVQLDRLEGNVLALGMEVQMMIQEDRGSLVAQETLLTDAMQARQLYLKQKYPDDQKLARLYDDENTQLQRISSWTKQYAANAQGIISFYTDGYENILNLNNYAGYSPTEVRRMFNGNIPPDPAITKNTVAVYRLVRQGTWVVLLLCRDRDWVPVEKNTYKLLIEGFDSTVVDAKLESFTRSGGELLLRLSVAGDINVGNILYVRTCTVMIGESVDSLTVPSRALYTRQGRTGVVIATEAGEFWTAVTVVANDGTMAHLIPENPGVLYEGIPVLLF